MQTTENNQVDYTRYYKRFHSDSPQHAKDMFHYYGNLLGKYLIPDKEIKILDVGCGMGFALMTLRDMGYLNLEGVDSDYGQVQSCHSKNLKVEHSEDTIRFLLDRAGKYDLILALDVIEHIPYDQQLSIVKAIRMALKPGGKLICKVPNANSALASRWRYNDWTHHISFTEHSLDFLLFNAGFTNIDVFEETTPSLPGLIDFAAASIKWQYIGPAFSPYLLRVFRFIRRLEMIAELGYSAGKTIPLSLNIIAIAQ